jgi:hypothetical protein
MADIFSLNTDQTILGPDGHAVANGQVHFYDRKTSEYAPVYGDARLSVTLRQPVQADSSGILPSIYLDDAIAYRAAITDRDNNRIREIDDVRRQREGIKVLAGIEALKRYCGDDPFVLVATKGGCPVFYKRLSGCDLPAEKLPEVVRAECGCDCSVAWQLCRNEPDICAMETAELNCDYHVLVQECPRETHSDGPVKPDGSPAPCHCDNGAEDSAPAVKKASIGALLNAAAKCAPRICIPHDAPEWTLAGGQMAYGDREPAPPEFGVMSGAFSACISVVVGTKMDSTSRHIRLDTLSDVAKPPVPVYFPKIQLTNKGPCKRRYEIRAINRLNRANEDPPTGADFGEVPIVNANFQTRLGKITDPRLDAVLGIVDYLLNQNWLTELSIADSTMGPFRSGILHDAPLTDHPYASAVGYTENNLIVDLNPGDSFWYALKYHIYWDMNAKPQDLAKAERIHFGTRIMARQIH